MSNQEIGSLTFLLFVLIASAHLLGHVFVRLRQPRVVGEILAGVVLGPSLLGRLAPTASAAIFSSDPSAGHDTVLNLIYWLGLLLLMYISGAETRGLFQRSDRREIAWLASFGTGLPFLVAVAAAAWLPMGSFMGQAQNRLSLLLVVGVAVAVTSIPVISRIFHDLNILHTRFARLVLGVAMIEDIVLWAVLAVATALATSAALPQQTIAVHLAATLLYFAVALTIAPPLLRRLGRASWNFLAQASPVAYCVVVLLAYSATAAAFDVSLVFAAFLAGFATATDREHLADALHSIGKFSFAVFIPIYFAIVGYRLDLGKSFSLGMLAGFLLAACAVKLASVLLGSKLAGFGRLDAWNLAVATNARGGPGIVVASVAYDAGIISAAFYTTLVLLAVLTSQAAGAWLEFVLRKGWPLLSAQAAAAAPPIPAQDELAA